MPDHPASIIPFMKIYPFYGLRVTGCGLQVCNREWLLAHLIHPAVNLVTILVSSGFHFADPANYFGIASAAEDFSMSATEYAYEF